MTFQGAPAAFSSGGISGKTLGPPAFRFNRPETASMVAEMFGAGDQLIAPGAWPGFPSRYAWPRRGQAPAKLQTIARHLAMRRVAKAPGGVRQRTYLERDR